jgi:dsRNA-specific ribonuclease
VGEWKPLWPRQSLPIYDDRPLKILDRLSDEGKRKLLTHQSVDSVRNYEELEWVGDAALELLARRMISRRYPKLKLGEKSVRRTWSALSFIDLETDLCWIPTQRLAQTVVRGTALSRIALSIGLARHIRCHPDKLSQDVLEDVMESLLAVMTEELGDQEAYVWLESVMGDMLDENKRRLYGPPSVLLNIDETVNILHPAPLWTWVHRRYMKLTREWIELFAVVRGRIVTYRKKLDHRIRPRLLLHRLGIAPRLRRVRAYVRGCWGSYRHQLKFLIRPRVIGTARGIANRMNIAPGLTRRAYVRGRWGTYRHHLNNRIRPRVVRTRTQIARSCRRVGAYLLGRWTALQRKVEPPGVEQVGHGHKPPSKLTLKRLRRRTRKMEKARVSPGRHKHAHLAKVRKQLSQAKAIESSDVPAGSDKVADPKQLAFLKVVDPKALLLKHTKERRVRYKTVKQPTKVSAEWQESVEVAGLGQFVGVGAKRKEAQKNAARMMLQSGLLAVKSTS